MNSWKNSSLLGILVHFCGTLRENGIKITPSEILDLSNALLLIDIGNKERVHKTLLTTLVKNVEDYALFEELFSRFWSRKDKDLGVPQRSGEIAGVSIPRGIQGQKSNSFSKDSAVNKIKRDTILPSSQPVLDQAINDFIYGMYSPVVSERAQSVPFLSFLEERARLKRALRTFSKAVSKLPGRRMIPSKNGEIDLRRTIRSSLRTGGNLIVRDRIEGKISRSRMIFLADVSGSMKAYKEKILQILYFAANTLHRTEFFAFSTSLIPLGKYLRARSFPEASRLVSENVKIWDSGTRTGFVLSDLVSRYPEILRPSAIMVIISDGWDLGDLNLLKHSLSKIYKRIGLLVWLNPHANEPDFAPEATGMKVALPYVDVFSGLDVFSDPRKIQRIFGKVTREVSSLYPKIRAS